MLLMCRVTCGLAPGPLTTWRLRPPELRWRVSTGEEPITVVLLHKDAQVPLVKGCSSTLWLLPSPTIPVLICPYLLVGHGLCSLTISTLGLMRFMNKYFTLILIYIFYRERECQEQHSRHREFWIYPNQRGAASHGNNSQSIQPTGKVTSGSKQEEQWGGGGNLT